MNTKKRVVKKRDIVLFLLAVLILLIPSAFSVQEISQVSNVVNAAVFSTDSGILNYVLNINVLEGRVIPIASFHDPDYDLKVLFTFPTFPEKAFLIEVPTLVDTKKTYCGDEAVQTPNENRHLGIDNRGMEQCDSGRGIFSTFVTGEGSIIYAYSSPQYYTYIGDRHPFSCELPTSYVPSTTTIDESSTAIDSVSSVTADVAANEQEALTLLTNNKEVGFSKGSVNIAEGEKYCKSINEKLDLSDPCRTNCVWNCLGEDGKEIPNKFEEEETLEKTEEEIEKLIEIGEEIIPLFEEEPPFIMDICEIPLFYPLVMEAGAPPLTIEVGAPPRVLEAGAPPLTIEVRAPPRVLETGAQPPIFEAREMPLVYESGVGIIPVLFTLEEDITQN